MAYSGFASLDTVADLYQKMLYDFERIKNARDDPYCAFDFFVTSLHLIDWIHPDSKHDRRILEGSNIYLHVCSHIANGAKHFSATAKKHKYVREVSQSFIRYDKQVENGFILYDSQTTGLIVRLDGGAKEQLGDIIKVENLAEEIVKFWTDKLKQLGKIE